jgi:ABC-type spermidine/putrescine transport system permease subunit II
MSRSWHDEALLAATVNSVVIAVMSTIGATVLGGLMALRHGAYVASVGNSSSKAVWCCRLSFPK